MIDYEVVRKASYKWYIMSDALKNNERERARENKLTQTINIFFYLSLFLEDSRVPSYDVNGAT